MSLSSQNGGLTRPGHLSLWNSLRSIQEILELTDLQMAEFLEITEREFTQCRAKKGKIYPRQAIRFAETLGFDLEGLMTCRVDLKTLARSYCGDAAIPEWYLEDAKSKRRTVASILDFIEKTFGYTKRSYLLRKFQLNERTFQDLDAPIHLNLTLDIASYLQSMSGGGEILHEMGMYSILNYRNTTVTEALGSVRRHRDAFELMFEQIAPTHLEKNYRWKVDRARNDQLVLKGYPHAQLLAEIQKSPVRHRLGCIIRTGFVSGMSHYLGRSIRTLKARCVTQGDSHCSFHIVEF